MNEPVFEDNIPFPAIIAGFLVLLLISNVIRRKLRQRALITQGQIFSDSDRLPTIEERVAGNRVWSSGEIPSHGKSLVAVLWTLAVVWNLTFGVSFVKSFSNPEMKTAAQVILGIFAVLGAVPIFFAVRFTLQQLRFGSSCCRIRGKAGVLGKELTGTIHTTNDIKVSGDYTFDLQCIESFKVGSGKNERTETRTHYQDSRKVSAEGQSSRRGIPFTFTLPEYPPETGHQLSRGRVSWQLKIHAPAKGVDYSALFTVPIFRMDYSQKG